MLVKLKDYERIHRIISSLARHEGNDPAYSCMWFSVFGAHILQHHFKAKPKVRCGLAAYYVGGENEVLCFGELTETGVTGALGNFHCWVEVDDWVIDFMAPAFPALLAPSMIIRPLMFQKRASEMATHINDLSHPGDFFLLPTDGLTEERLKQFWEYPIYGDLAEICAQWFSKSPKKIRPEIGMLDNFGKQVAVSLTGPSVRGRW